MKVRKIPRLPSHMADPKFYVEFQLCLVPSLRDTCLQKRFLIFLYCQPNQTPHPNRPARTKQSLVPVLIQLRPGDSRGDVVVLIRRTVPEQCRCITS